MPRSIEDVQQKILTFEVPAMKRTSRAEYDSIQRMNPSTLVNGLRGRAVDPYAVKLAWEGEETERTAASQDRMDRGTLAHLMILEPHTVDQRVAIWSGKVRSGKEWEAFQVENANQLIMRKSDFDEVRHGALIAAACPEIRSLLSDCEIEAALLWNEQSILCKGLVDAVSQTTAHGTVNIPDLKTSARIDEQSAVRTIQSLHYRQKMSLYRRAVAKIRNVPTSDVRCFNLFVQIEPPYGVNIMQLGSDGLDWAEKQMLNLIGEVERCIDSGVWKPLVIRSSFGMTSWEQFESETLDMGDGDEQ